MQTVVAGLQLQQFLADRAGHGIECFRELTDFVATAHRQGHIVVPGSDLTAGHRELLQVARQPGANQAEQQHRQHQSDHCDQHALLQQGLLRRGQELSGQPVVQPAVLLIGQDDRCLGVITIAAVGAVLGDVTVGRR